jgi:hypothetical protein
MTTLNKAIKTYGFENPITITIAVLEEQGKTELAEQLYDECLALGCEEGDEDPWDEDEEYLNGDEEMGFDPYEGCYTFDC